MIEFKKSDAWFRRIAEREKGTIGAGPATLADFLRENNIRLSANQDQPSVNKQKRQQKSANSR